MHRINARRPSLCKTLRVAAKRGAPSCLSVASICFSVALVILCGCGSQPSATITAVPNPVPLQGKKGTTTISWRIDDGSKGQVYVSINGGEEKLFAGLTASGSQSADWISSGTYDFRLYAGPDKAELLANVTVTPIAGPAPPSSPTENEAKNEGETIDDNADAAAKQPPGTVELATP